jgi:hypothetical protein
MSFSISTLLTPHLHDVFCENAPRLGEPEEFSYKPL